MDEQSHCPFCDRIRRKEHLLIESDHGVVFADGFPVSPGHCLIASRSHVADFLALPAEERAGLLDLMEQARTIIENKLHPDGYNLGANIGTYGGQTVFHANLHLIPRFAGDVGDPRGGVRWVVPASAPYWKEHRRPLNYSLIPDDWPLF